MKKAFIVILLFFLSGVGSFAQEQNEFVGKNTIKLGMELLINPHCHKGYHAVELLYRRNIWKGLGVSAGYQFYTFNFDYMWNWGVSSTKPYCDVKVHSALTRIDYQINFLRHFSVGAFGQLGLDWKEYDYQKRYREQTNEKDNALSYGGGMFLEYHFFDFAVYLIYEYCRPQINVKYLKDNIYEKDVLVHQNTGIGVAYSF